MGKLLWWGIIRIAPEFLLGSITYLWFWKYDKSTILNSFLFLILLAVVAYILTSNVQFSIVLVIPIILLTLHKGGTLIDLIFGNKLMVFLGEISYSIYMLHFFSRSINGILHSNLFGEDLNSPIYFINYTILTILFSTLGYKLIEVPMRRKINNLV